MPSLPPSRRERAKRTTTPSELSGWQPADRTGLLGLALDQGRRQIIPVFDAALASVGRGHPVTSIIEQAPGQERSGLHPGRAMMVRLCRQPHLYRLKQLSIQDRGLFPTQDLSLKHHRANVERL
jgi:hypothetical protein